jgi:hypothetical protein
MVQVENQWILKPAPPIFEGSEKNSGVLTPKFLSDQIWVDGYFGQPLTYPYFTIFISDFLCNSLKP